jgi:hypothetical protein
MCENKLAAVLSYIVTRWPREENPQEVVSCRQRKLQAEVEGCVEFFYPETVAGVCGKLSAEWARIYVHLKKRILLYCFNKSVTQL